MARVVKRKVRHSKIYSKNRLKKTEEVVAIGSFFICRKISKNLNDKISLEKFNKDQIFYEVL